MTIEQLRKMVENQIAVQDRTGMPRVIAADWLHERLQELTPRDAALEAVERERDEARASEKDADAARNEHYERTSRTIENLRRERDDTKKRATEAEAEVVRLRSQRASHA